jgi:hypothetical protein
LKEFGSTPKEHPLVMPATAQYLLLYHLQAESLEGINLKAIADFLKESNNYNNLQNEQVLRLINLLLINQHVLNASISAVTNILLKRNNSRITKDILSNKTDVSSEQDLDW